jgi:hypothetical protein
MIFNLDQKVDMFWQQRLHKKHKNIDEFKKKLSLCLGYYNERVSD